MPARIDRDACLKCFEKIIIDPRKEVVETADVVIPQDDGTLVVYRGPQCLTACPSDAIRIVQDEVVVDVGACVDECLPGAIELF